MQPNKTSLGRWMAAAGTTIVLVTSLAACGNSDESADTTTSVAVGTGGTGAQTSSTTTAPTADFANFCDTWLKIDSTPSPGGPDGPPPADEVKKYAETVKPLAAELSAEAPPELVAPLGTLTAAVDAAAESGKTESMESEDFGKASAVGEKWIHENCGYQNLDVTAIDYAYEGIPLSVATGKTSIQVTNHSTHHEMHEMIILRRKPGVTDPIGSLLALPEDQVFAKVDFVGAIFAPMGQSSGTAVDLVKGEYIAVCFLPVDGKDANPPHFTKGMLAEFKVA